MDTTKVVKDHKNHNQFGGFPVFWFLQNELGTTLIHFTIDEKKTLCGIDCNEWYGDDDLAFDDVECKRCRKARKQS